MTTLYQAQQEVNAIAQAYIDENFAKVSASKVNLDSMCGAVFVSDGAVAVYTSNVGRLNYYGGFEYIDKSDVTVLGEYTIYSNDDRVYEVIDAFEDLQAQTA